jgi:predicted amidohydrolase
MTMKTPDIFEGNPPTLRLAMCQVETAPWDIDRNLANTLAALDEAGGKGADLAITPECVFHGYGFDGVGDVYRATLEQAEPLDGARLAAVRTKARNHGMDVVVGFAERDADDRVFNSAVLIDRGGEVVNVYRKVHLRDFESARGRGAFTPGDAFHVAPRAYPQGAFQVGTMICFDREVPESVRCLRAQGAELIACPLATDTGRLDAVGDLDNEVITRCRAAENEVFIAVVNHAGRFNGGSFVVGPGGEVITQMGAAPGVEVIDLPVGAIARRFHSDPLGWMGWGYRRPELYERYIGPGA